MNNYMQYMGQTGVSTHTYVSERKADCEVCSLTIKKVSFNKSKKLKAILKYFMFYENLVAPSINVDDETLYMSKPESLEKMHHHKLDLTIEELIFFNTIPK